MDLVELHPDKLSQGMSLGFTLRDNSGMILLAKGNRIESASQLESIKSRGKLFVEIDETEEGMRAMMAGLVELNLIGGAIKDFSKYVGIGKESPAEEKLTGSLVQRLSDVESRLGGLLNTAAAAVDFEQRLRVIEGHIDALMTEDSTGTQFLLFNRAVTHFGGYSVLHSMLCACLAHSLAPVFALSDDERRSLVCAALTMNIAMTQVQDELALQKSAPSPHQRSVIDGHAAQGRQMLSDVGVVDPVWLEVVALHHAPLSGPDLMANWPQAQRLAKLLQTVDRYTAAMSPRKSRSGRTAKDSVRAVVLPSGTTKQDEAGSALVRILGLCPPGTFVKLVNGETAVVLRRGVKPGEPFVASVLNRNDEPIAEPRLHDTSRETLKVLSTLVASTIRVNLKLNVMLRLIPRQATPGATA
jgi:HD-GYP domain-containing protein (c-di-GMP phosphodiesterase class II)